MTDKKLKYTDTVNKFIAAGCVLLIDENQFNLLKPTDSTILLTKALCGHDCKLSLLQVKNNFGYCVPCTNANKQRTPYDEVKKIFTEANCTVLCDEKEFKIIYKNSNSKLKYIATCGHEHETTYANFKNGKARNCTTCSRKLTGQKTTERLIAQQQLQFENNIIECGKTKLNWKKVADKFTSNGCELLINSNEKFLELYKGISSILPYKAQCGHENKMSYKCFSGGSGLLCKSCTKINTAEKIGKKQRKDYQTVKQKFEEKGCKLILNEDEFNVQYKNNNTKLPYIATCGHDNKTSYGHFGFDETYGLLCLDCTNKKVGVQLKTRYAGENKLQLIQLEYNAIKYLTNLIEKDFECVKANDGCKSDIIIKLKNTNGDSYVGIQVKSTKSINNKNQYSFNFGKKTYENTIIVCICTQDKKLWCFEQNAISECGPILSITSNGKYSKLACTEDNILQPINLLYNKMQKSNITILNTPLNEKTKQELALKTLREEKIHWINFIQSDMEGTVFDFKVNNLKFQEKVGSVYNEDSTINVFYLSKKCGAKNKQCYEIGDNDFYWLNFKNLEIFYVIPEKELVDRKIIGRENKKPVKLKIYLNRDSWTKPYEFSYLEPNKNKLDKLILSKQKSNEKHFDL